VRGSPPGPHHATAGRLDVHEAGAWALQNATAIRSSTGSIRTPTSSPKPSSAGLEKTSYVGDIHGAEPGAAPWQKTSLTAQVRSDGPNIALWITGVLAALALIGYALGFFA
jgi:hypothetical protein